MDVDVGTGRLDTGVRGLDAWVGGMKLEQVDGMLVYMFWMLG